MAKTIDYGGDAHYYYRIGYRHSTGGFNLELTGQNTKTARITL